jgi:hypothetical protein
MKTMKKSFTQIAVGAVLGAGAAFVLGSGGLWLAVGIVIGILIGGAVARRTTATRGPSAIRESYTDRLKADS